VAAASQRAPTLTLILLPSASRGAGLTRRALVAAQVALAFVLLIGGGLLFASFRHLLAVDTGFNPSRVLTGTVNLPWVGDGDHASRNEIVDRALEHVRRLPGVAAAGATDAIPFGSGAGSRPILPEAYAPTPGESVISPNTVRITLGYFEAGCAIEAGSLLYDE